MLRTFLRPEIHRAMVTGSDLNYAGSLTLSPELLEAADIGVHELVQVVNSNNGAQFETYAQLTDSELAGYQPQIVHVDGQNRIMDPAAAEAADPAGSGGAVRRPAERIRAFSDRADGYRVGLTVIAFAVASRRVRRLVRLAFSGQPAPESNEVWIGREVT